MVQSNARIVYNRKVRANFWHCSLRIPAIAAQAEAGQFVNIRVNDSAQPLLRRPFSIHRAKGSLIEILYEVVGKGSEILSQRKVGGYLDIIGPLGKGFDCALRTTHDAIPTIVAGGMGVAPLVFLAEKLAGVKSQKSKVKIVVLIGAKTKNQILCEKEFKKLGCEVRIATDDGSRGFKGKVTDLLKNLLSTMDRRPSTIYSCGPRPLLRVVSELSKSHKIPAQISLEEHLACGIGACLGCVVNTRDGFKRVCKEGPVLNASEIIWD